MSVKIILYILMLLTDYIYILYFLYIYLVNNITHHTKITTLSHLHAENVVQHIFSSGRNTLK